MSLHRAATPDEAPWNARQVERSTRSRDRGAYDIDRDRIVHSDTFRELQHKTQVQSIVDASSATRFRTRLNHVLEVAQLARSLARAIGANETLCEAISLAHDLGHPPFGHAGERALRRALATHGFVGWNANVHSLDVVDSVESSFLRFRGLDLTWASREGIARHSTPFDDPVSFGEFTRTPHGGLECQIVDASDVLAYLTHDLDDALADAYVSLVEVAETSDVIADILESAERVWSEQGRAVWPLSDHDSLVRRYLVGRIINACVTDVSHVTAETMAQLGVDSPSAVRSLPDRVVRYSTAYTRLTKSLLELLTTCYYRSDKVGESDKRAEQVVTALFEAFYSDESLVPPRFQRHDRALGVATFLASLNDRSATDLAARLAAGTLLNQQSRELT